MTTNEMFPALTGNVVTEAHAKICKERGHATHKVDGVESSICPRCGEKKDSNGVNLATAPLKVDKVMEAKIMRGYLRGVRTVELVKRVDNRAIVKVDDQSFGIARYEEPTVYQPYAWVVAGDCMSTEEECNTSLEIMVKHNMTKK